jgi:hypothetical protein
MAGFVADGLKVSVIVTSVGFAEKKNAQSALTIGKL